MAIPIFQRTIVKDNGDVIPNAQVEVRVESSGALATLYSDRAGTVLLSNPFNADSTGLAEFYASAGEYKITATGSGSEIIWRYFVLVDLATLGDPATIVHAPGSGLDNEAGTAYASDITTTASDTTTGSLVKVGDNGTDQFPLLAPLASPSLTGTPTAPTATASDSSTQIATTAFVNSEVGTANSALVKTALNASGTAPIYACRAWVNFNGTGTVAINSSGNVSSITDNGTGDYTINFTTSMPDINYSCVASSTGLGASYDRGVAGVEIPKQGGINSVSSIQLVTATNSSAAGNGAIADRDVISVSIFT